VSEQRENAATPPLPPLELVAPLPAACSFFRAERPSLDVTKPDGTTGRLVALPAPRLLARSPSGEIVEVQPRPRVVSKEKIKVERTCSRMPLEELEPLRRAPLLVVMWAAPALRTIEMPFDREDLDVECTRNVY
jgi:hypothetical protein